MANTTRIPLLRWCAPTALNIRSSVLLGCTSSLSFQSRRFVGGCCVAHYFEETSYGDTAFSMRSPNIKFGHGVIKETGDDMSNLLAMSRRKSSTNGSADTNHSRVAVFTDSNLRDTWMVDQVIKSLNNKGLDVHIYSDICIEPTNTSIMLAAQWAHEGRFSGYVSVGGGSVMDTTKAAILYAEVPPPSESGFLHYVNAPVGHGHTVSSTIQLSPHIAIPTTAGTGSECTGFAICALENHPTLIRCKTGIASPVLIPSLAIVDPTVTHSLPHNVVAAAGFDVLSHAIESYTARPYTQRKLGGHDRHIRPLNQGANPFSDIACVEALRIVGRFFHRALTDSTDIEAREQMMWASTIVGTSMGNAGVHAPHGLSYPVCGSVKNYRPNEGYPTDRALVPHGMGVILCAPSVFRLTASACPDRHFLAAELLGSDMKTADKSDAGEVLAQQIISLIRTAGFPNGLSAVGVVKDDISSLVTACFEQKRVIDNAPLELEKDMLVDVYEDAFTHW